MLKTTALRLLFLKNLTKNQKKTLTIPYILVAILLKKLFAFRRCHGIAARYFKTSIAFISFLYIPPIYISISYRC